MKARPASEQIHAVIDPESPWTATQRHGNYSHSYTMSASQWRALLSKAKRGDPEAEWEVGDRYGDGCRDRSGRFVVKRDRRKAAQWFRRAADHGYAPAQNALGVLLSCGGRPRKDVDEALAWFRKAFHAGESYAAQNIALTYRQIGELKAAVKWLRKSAAVADGDALVQLGIHYYWGKGVKRNAKAAVRCFRLAAKAKYISGVGTDDAFFFLGIAYFEGQGVRRSIPNARKIFQRANVDGDHPHAREMLQRLQCL
jgi:TPR repeat protein